MTVSLRYDFKSYNRVRNSLRGLASGYKSKTDDTVKDWTKEQRRKHKAQTYPPQLNKPQPFKTEKQRRFFFWALDNGIIIVPYPRTGLLANSWRARQEGWSHWVLENSAAYAHLVVGKGQQARYHEGHWWTAEDIISDEVGKLTSDLTEELLELAKM